MRKTLHFLSLAALIVLCFGFTSCAKPEISEDAKEKAAQAFLTEFFSFKHRQRYDILSESLKSADETGEPSIAAEGLQALSEKQRQAYEEYYRPFAAIATRDCIEAMQAGRLPLKYESLMAQNGVTAEIEEINLAFSKENSCTFEVSFHAEEGNTSFQSPVKGRLTIQTVEGQVYVDSITIF